MAYEYTENGGVSKVAWGNRHFLRFFRDLVGNTVRMETPVGTFDMHYDYNKRTVQRAYPNGAVSQFTYNRDGRPVSIQHAAPDGRVILEFK